MGYHSIQTTRKINQHVVLMMVLVRLSQGGTGKPNKIIIHLSSSGMLIPLDLFNETSSDSFLPSC